MSKIIKVISGGQSGSDRAGLEAAIRLGIPHGGYCPAGRIAEDGPILLKYNLEETKSSNYYARTLRNIQASDGTVLFADPIKTEGGLKGGSLLTYNLCSQEKKPITVFPPWVLKEHREMMKSIFDFWVDSYDVKILNVAGSRESKSPGIYRQVLDFLLFVLK